MIERWRSRRRTAEAIVALCIARLTVAAIPFKHWRQALGGTQEGRISPAQAAEGASYAAHVEWAARLLPFATKCLPRAMALSWILRRRDIGHCIVFAVRPAELRGAEDQLHAWVEIAGKTLIGDLPGPWVETLRLGNSDLESR